jgi:fibrillarin-like pre-rRNA processing protein
MLAVKARSEDVTRDPREVFRDAATYLKLEGFKVLEITDLEPFEKDHAMIVVKR